MQLEGKKGKAEKSSKLGREPRRGFVFNYDHLILWDGGAAPPGGVPKTLPILIPEAQEFTLLINKEGNRGGDSTCVSVVC